MKRIDSKQIKKWATLFLAALLAAFLLEIVQIRTQPGTVLLASTAEIRANESAVYPDRMTRASGYTVTVDGLVREASDPQLYVAADGSGTVSQVYLYFSKPLEASLQIQVFYPGENGYTEENSVISECPEGTDFWAVALPAGEYETLRIDLDGLSTVPLAFVSVGNLPPERIKTSSGMHPLRIAAVTVLLLAALCWMAWCGVWAGMRNALRGGFRGIREGGRKSAAAALAFPAAIGISVFLFWIFCTVFAGKPMTSPRIVFAGFVGFFAACLLVFRKTLKAKPEYLFLVLTLCVGFLYCWYVPHTGLNSWDEDVHYIQALKTSYVDSLVMTPQDEITADRNVPASYDLNGGIRALHDRQDELYRQGATEKRTVVSITSIPELFNGIGLFLGRAFGLRYYQIHFLGRFTGLLTYAVLGFLAIRRLKSGKMIAAVSLMIPTEVFIASSYNYDCYLTGFTALGLCVYLSIRQDRAAKVSLKDAVLMIGSIAFGCLTKPIYIPLLWILVLLPKDRFADGKARKRFILAMAAATGLVVFSYLLPSLVRGNADAFSDMRGGSEVNAVAQLKTILRDPLHYIRVMWDYLISAYFNLSRIGEMFTNFPYNGIMPNQYLYLVLLLAVAFTDKNEYDRELAHRPWSHLWPMILSFVVVVLAMTSMYLAFTPVGADYIAGAQFRYLIPMILPVLLHLGSGLVENHMDRGWYNGLVFGAAAFVGFACVYNGYICKYF